jgi:lipoprotein-anchoring transpeptidase ErfK/SrfK
MGKIDHSFDWKSLLFVAAAVVLLAGAGIGIQGGARYLATPTAQGAPESEPAASPLTLAYAAHLPARTLNSMSVAEAVPAQGKFIAADLHAMRMSLYQDGTLVAEYPITSKGRVGSAWETPSGSYTIRTKEREHFSSIGHVYMPYSMQFYGNYFIHGHPYYPDGTPTPPGYSGGCIRLGTQDAQQVYEFADAGTQVLVYDPKHDPKPASLYLSGLPLPRVQASSYLVADLDTGDVFAERGAQATRPIGSIAKLMTALVANETISFDKKVSLPLSALAQSAAGAETTAQFLVGDALYPLLLLSSDEAADALGRYYGTHSFVAWMNATAKAFRMEHTVFADPGGASRDTTSTADDVYRLAQYLGDKKTFILKITHAARSSVASVGGSTFELENLNTPLQSDPYLGGKAAHTASAEDGMIAIVSLEVGAAQRRAAIVVLGSDDPLGDIQALTSWITATAKESSTTACAACALPAYRKIELF